MEIWKYGNNGCQRGRVDLKRLRKVSHWDGLASGLEKREDADEDMGVEEGNGERGQERQRGAAEGVLVCVERAVKGRGWRRSVRDWEEDK